MTINLYTVTVPRIQVNKNVSNPVTVEGQIETGYSISQPYVRVKDILPIYNYAYISDYKRYYWIKKSEWLGNNIWGLTLEVDPDYTYMTPLLTHSAFVSRWEGDTNHDIPDGEFPLRDDPTLSLEPTKPSYITGLDYWYGTEDLFTANIANVVITVSAELYYDVAAAINCTCPGPSKIVCGRNACNQLFRDMTTLASAFLDDPFSKIIDVTVLPFDLSHFASVSNWTRVNGFQWGTRSSRQSFEFDIDYHYYAFEATTPIINIPFSVTHIPVPAFKYMRYEPFTSFTLKFAPFGSIGVNPEFLQWVAVASGDDAPGYWKATFNMTYNLLNGYTEIYQTYPGTPNKFLYLGTANCEYHIPFSQNVQSGAMFAGAVTGMVSGLQEGGGPGGLIGGAKGFLNTAMGSYSPKIGGSISSGIIDKRPYILVVQHPISDSPNIRGYALEKEVVLSTLVGTGYTQISNINLEGMSYATSEELDMLEQHLKAGVIL